MGAEKTCRCEATDKRVCWMIQYGEARGGRNPSCSCQCHERATPEGGERT